MSDIDLPGPTNNLITKAYNAFNNRDIDAALTTMAIDVIWPNGMEGGVVLGHQGVREYWTRQWSMIDPHVEPVRLNKRGQKIVVDVHQVVRNMDGLIVLDKMVQHVYQIKNGLIARMEIRTMKSTGK